MEVYNLKDKMNYLEEVATLEYEEWAENPNNNKEERITKKKDKIKSLLDNKSFCKLLLIDKAILIGFISLFPSDGVDEVDLTPWYATMFVKKEYRGMGYSKLLNDALLEEARNRGFKTIYLKTDLINYYDKFGAVFIKELKTKELLYKYDL